MNAIHVCSLVWNANECWPFPDVNEVQTFCVNFLRTQTQTTDFAVVHDSLWIGAGASIAPLRKLEDGELSDKVLSRRATTKLVTWQLLSMFVRSHYTWPSRDSKAIIIITYRQFALAKTDTENCNTIWQEIIAGLNFCGWSIITISRV